MHNKIQYYQARVKEPKSEPFTTTLIQLNNGQTLIPKFARSTVCAVEKAFYYDVLRYVLFCVNTTHRYAPRLFGIFVSHWYYVWYVPKQKYLIRSLCILVAMGA
jgi:hypothetical protein